MLTFLYLENLVPTVNEDIVKRVGGNDLIGWHHCNGRDIDASVYQELYRSVLLNGLSRTKRLYLDTNYWICLRDAELGCGTPDAIRLLQTLRAMVRSREIICVGHFPSFLEIGKQDETCLRVTASLLDELTEAVVIASPDNLLAFECAEYIEAKLGFQLHHGLSVWTKAGLIHNQELPNQISEPTTPVSSNVILKSLIDTLWNASFKDIFGTFEWDTKSSLNPDIDQEVLLQVEQRKKEQEAKGLLRKQVRQNEFLQVVSEQLRPVFTDQLRKWHIQQGFSQGLGAILVNLQVVLESAVKEFRAGTLGRLLPCVAIPVELYSLYETNHFKKAPLLTNDWFDWKHAAAAVAYCDLFFTEKHLAHLLCQELKADQQYGCEVISKPGDGLRKLCAMR